MVSLICVTFVREIVVANVVKIIKFVLLSVCYIFF